MHDLRAPIKPSRFWPPKDRHDEPIPHKLETISFLRAVPHMLSFFDAVVPAEFWTEETLMGADSPQIVIACPCGEEPTLCFRLRSFSIAECGCGRFFMHDGTQVRVGKSDDDAS